MKTTHKILFATVSALAVATPAYAQETTATPEKETQTTATTVRETPAKTNTPKASTTKAKPESEAPSVTVEKNGDVVTDIDGEKKVVTTEDEAKAGENTSDEKPLTTPTDEKTTEQHDTLNDKIAFSSDMTNEAVAQALDKLNEKYLAVKSTVDDYIEKHADSEIGVELVKIRDSVTTLNDLGKELLVPVDEREKDRTDEVIKQEMADVAKTIEDSLYSLQDKGVDTSEFVGTSDDVAEDEETSAMTQEQTTSENTAKAEAPSSTTQANRGVLASTGASVIGIAVLGLLLIAGVGVFMFMRRNNNE